ncbi:phosphatase PAP2 family protein [Olivibacter sp. SDN3]|uniref:phosphatase PAP2 family protein n=1 Tax=Olivibacter sp. SDN3 TaxID=2764720 RepID=UPI0016518F90|nr:phosphatase PAP2 family protein [Olivibacter sp. SDN3]QNL51272.1 phosphatase PAP2 family protein [Olivibacter sp. SDN3]
MEKSKPVSYFTFIKNFDLFIFLLLLSLLIGFIFSSIYSQADLFLVINHLHQPLADKVFMVITHMGDWPFTVGLAIIYLFIQFRYALVLVSTMLYTGFFTQLIKLIVKHPRPSVYFESLEPIYTIKNYVLENSLSFPSGHTTCVFSLAISLSYIFFSRRHQFWFFLIALTVAFSRVYLSQHFFKDLMAGATIGTFFALHLLWLFGKADWFCSNTLNGKLLTTKKRNNTVS